MPGKMTYSPSLEFIHAVQTRAARIAASPSATRKQGMGAVKAAREFFKKLKLEQFAVSSERAFRKRLNQATEDLCAALPRRARSWGLARKLLNIFLRDALYTTHLAAHFHLTIAESLFELPLDSITAGHIRKDAGRDALPRWKGVRYLTRETSDQYQQHALQLALTCRFARIHLDTYWWGERDGKSPVQSRVPKSMLQAAHPRTSTLGSTVRESKV